MKTLTVFDPAMCCSTGVCGPDVDQAGNRRSPVLASEPAGIEKLRELMH